MDRAGFYDHHENQWLIRAVADSNGLAQGFLGPCSEGYCWYVERMTTWANASRTAAVCEVFVQTANKLQSSFSATVGDRTGRQDVSINASNDVADENSPIYVGPGQYLIAAWSGFTSGDLVELSVQAAIHLLALAIEDPALVRQQALGTPDLNVPAGAVELDSGQIVAGDGDGPLDVAAELVTGTLGKVADIFETGPKAL